MTRIGSRLAKLWRLVAQFPVRQWPSVLRCALPISRTQKRIRLAPRAIGPVVVRKGTTDFRVLANVIADGYHTPPQELPRGATILDLGCNVGYTLVHYARTCDNPRLVGVEMDDTNMDMAQENTATISNLTLIRAAVSAKRGVVRYMAADEADSFSIADDLPADAVEVRSATIEDILSELAIDVVDFLKMDIEGAELSIFFDTSADWLDRVRSVNIEVHGNQADVDRIMQILVERGFDCAQDKRHWALIAGTK